MKKAVLIIGAGGHLGSLLTKLIHSLNVFSIIFATRRDEKKGFHGLECIAECGGNNNNNPWAEKSNVLLLCTKPQDALTTLLELPQALQESSKNIISICASLQIKQIEKCIGNHHQIIRVIPNVFVKNRCSITFVSFGNSSKDFQKEVLDMFSKMGKIMVIPEELMNSATVLGASMPAIIAYLLLISNVFNRHNPPEYLKSILITIIEDSGFSNGNANVILSQNLKGLESIYDTCFNRNILEKLVDEVATKGGCTEMVIKRMEECGLEQIINDPDKTEMIYEIIKNAITAGIQRLDTLSSDLKKSVK